MFAACLRLRKKECCGKSRALGATNEVFESCGEGLCLLCIKWGTTGGPSRGSCVYGEGLFQSSVYARLEGIKRKVIEFLYTVSRLHVALCS